MKKIIVSSSILIVFLISLVIWKIDGRASEEDRIPILIYHDIRDNYDGNNPIVLDTQSFKEGLLYLKALNYNTISFYDYLEYKNGLKNLPENPVILTFDDGYYSNYSIAYPILKRLNMKASFGIIGWSVGKDTQVIGNNPIIKHFSWEEAKEMEESGLITIESHSYNLHNIGNRRNESNGVIGLYWEKDENIKKRIIDDDFEIQKQIYNNLKHKSKIFTYPFGRRTDLTDRIYRELGYEFTLGTDNGISDLSKERDNLKRINSYNYEARQFIKNILKEEKKSQTIPFEDIENQEERIKLLEQEVNIKLN